MALGLPYKGSKNAIAKRLIDALPPGGTFYDLFCGGGAMTHAAMLSGKYSRFVMNDIDADLPELFKECASGRFEPPTEWVSREDFLARKASDPVIRYCWSFGNNGQRYLYSREIEPWKKALHYARVRGDCSLLRAFGINSDGSKADIRSHFAEYLARYSDWYRQNYPDSKKGVVVSRLHELAAMERLARLAAMERLARLAAMERLARLAAMEQLATCGGDYQAVPIDGDGVIYCDIPYRGTDGYASKNTCDDFDFERFYDWCERQTLPVYVSEYWMPPERFRCVAEIPKKSTLASASNATQTMERLFVPIKQASQNAGLFL